MVVDTMLLAPVFKNASPDSDVTLDKMKAKVKAIVGDQGTLIYFDVFTMFSDRVVYIGGRPVDTNFNTPPQAGKT